MFLVNWDIEVNESGKAVLPDILFLTYLDIFPQLIVGT